MAALDKPAVNFGGICFKPEMRTKMRPGYSPSKQIFAVGG